MENAESIKETVEKYMETQNIPENELYIDIQLEFDEEDDVFVISYGLKQKGTSEGMHLNPEFHYEDIEEAWINYLDQLPEIHQQFRDATINTAHPDNYTAAKGGGNPAIRIVDERKEF